LPLVIFRYQLAHLRGELTYAVFYEVGHGDGEEYDRRSTRMDIFHAISTIERERTLELVAYRKTVRIQVYLLCIGASNLLRWSFLFADISIRGIWLFGDHQKYAISIEENYPHTILNYPAKIHQVHKPSNTTRRYENYEPPRLER
jgi:hypothetical protein